jgi:dihydroorotate dehydrogenase electron transfer subunit
MIARRDLRARVVGQERLSGSCFDLRLEAGEAIGASPGQFVMVACTGGLDPLLRRAFSIAGVQPSPAGSEIELMVKQVGRGTGCLGRVRPGDDVRLLAPLGNGFNLEGDGRPLALVAGGIGLPPLLFAAEVLAARGAPFDLFVGAATADELLVVERCTAAVNRVGGELVLTTDDGTRGEAGFVTAALERRVQSGREYIRALACGPDPMLKALARLATGLGLPAEVSLEEPMACGVGVCLGCVVELADGRLVPSCKEGPVFPVERLAERWRA